MRKSKNMGGEPIFIFKIEMPVSRGIFAHAIAGYFHESGGEFNPTMTKREGIQILKKGLRLNGVEGVDTNHWDGATIEFVKAYQDAYRASLKWLEKNYPYLSK